MKTCQLSSIRNHSLQATHGAAVGLRRRFKAAGAHLAFSVAVAGCVLALVYFGWYREPLDSISGVGEILLFLLVIDVTLGPLLTLIVYDRRKRNLRFDLACIALVQITALIYGLWTVEAGRPHYLVFVKDRFEVVSRVDLQLEDRMAAVGNLAAGINFFSTNIVAAEMPTSEQARKDLLFESVLGGRDVHHFPKQYRDYGSQAALAATKATLISELRAMNPDGDRVLRSAIDGSGLSEERLKFLPIKGPRGDATMLVDASSGAIAGMVALQPWR